MRKIKLMALLLATLMVVAAFAGCAGVKKEELDAIDVRVQALEDLLNGQQAALEEIKNSVAGGNDYTEILDAIESVKTDLEDKIKDVNDRIDDEIGKGGLTTSVSDETKAAQQKALALIEVRRAEYSKNYEEYTTEEYTMISEALGTATGAVNAATTVEAVDAAMAALDAELGKYMTYAMKAYDYYVQLLGNINADAEDLVAEAKAFLKEVAKVYEGTDKLVGKLDSKPNNSDLDRPAVVVELAYLVSEGSTEKNDDYIDTYTAIKNLCDIYTKTTLTGELEIPYVADNGKVKTFEIDQTLSEYTEDAETLVERIEDELGEEFYYKSAGYNSFNPDLSDSLVKLYENYVEAASFLGGQKLVDLVTNAADIIAAEEAYNLLAEAAAEFDKATRVKAGNYKDVFYYYTQLGDDMTALEISDEDDYVWVADEYEKVDDILASWIAEFELSEKNVEEIIKDKKNDTFYNTYKLNKHTNDLYVAAVNEFKNEIAPKILDLNEADAPSVDMVLAYDEIEELFEDFLVLQEKSTEKDAEYKYTVDINIDDIDNLEVIIREADLFEDFEEERLKVVFDGMDDDDIDGFLVANGLIDLYTFEADVDEIEGRDDDNEEDLPNVYFDDDDDNRDTGKIFKFLTEEYTVIKNIADGINDRIEALVEKVEDNAIYSNLEFVELEGVYKTLEDTDAFESDNENFADLDTDETLYVAVADCFDKAGLKAYMESLVADDDDLTDDTIEAFKAVYADFVEMINVDEFNAAKATMDARVKALFDLAEQFVEEYNAINFVREGAKLFEDKNNNGKYDEEFDVIVGDYDDVAYLVSLDDKADVDVALATFNKWAKQGGNLNQAMFTNYVDADDEVYTDVFFMYTLNGEARTEVSEATTGIHNLRADIVDLEATAAKFATIVKNVKAVDAYNKFAITYTESKLTHSLDNLAHTNRLALTKFTKSTKDGADALDGTYSYVKSGDATDASGSKSVKDASEVSQAVTQLSGAMRKSVLLDKALEAYNAFAHNEYVPATNNDYDNGEIYYTVVENVPYAAFDTAAKDYAAYDLYYVKCKVIDVVKGNKDVDELNANEATFIRFVVDADSISALDNYISMYNSMGAINIANNFVADNSIAK